MRTQESVAVPDQAPAARSFIPLAGFMVAMTIAWAINAMSADAGVLRVLAWVAVAAGLLAVPIGLFLLRRPERPAPTGRAGRFSSMSPGVQFLLAGLIEVVMIGGAVVVPRLLDRPDLTMPLIAAVVGLHFVIFYVLQGHPLHVVTTVVGTLAGLVPFVLGLMNVISAPDARGIAGVGLAACTATYAVLFGNLATRR